MLSPLQYVSLIAISQDPGCRFYCSVTYVERKSDMEDSIGEMKNLMLTPPCQCVVLNKKEK